MDEYQALQEQRRWQSLEPHSDENFVIGIMGLGVLGSKVAQRLASFGFSVKGWSRRKKEIAGIATYSQQQFADFLQQTRVIVNLLPSTPDTQGILNKTLFAQLKQGAYLINVARGEHLVEEDLLDALDSGQLKAATLDVFLQEPLSKQHVFWQRPEITVTPHISAITLPQVAMEQICRQLKAFQAGEAISGVVNMARGY
ncbi:Glyoxylate/hydroxypyruvate reductase A [Pragia fontium]|uniref:NAD(P)-dependent oxidoreductase n=1 Tax=Pragia fontium TaxID=82985 RepID=UPI000E05F647|nr:NAD(P)-dependent oxidoreductase [Pragia fontium]SUB82753.1 Glyoxylate/hydroxypyruvate reductase A [Pragia fontium]